MEGAMNNVTVWLLSYLVNSLWQVPLIFAVAWVAAWILRTCGSAVQHRVWVCAIMLEALLPGCAVQDWRWLRGMLWHGRPAAIVGHGQVTAVMGTGMGLARVHLPAGLLLWIAAGYAAVTIYFAARLGWRWFRTTELRREAMPATMTFAAGRFWDRCCDLFQVRESELRISYAIAGPVTLGVHRRLVLLPVRMLETLAEEDLQTALAHEFAHMQRRDFSKNLFYEALCVMIGFHPMYWLTREQLVETREETCDAMAAEAVAGRDRYARSLLRLAALFLEGRSLRASHAIGIFDANQFERRMVTLMRNDLRTGGFRKFALIAGCGVLALGTCVSALALRTELTVAGARGVESAGPAADGNLKVPAKVMAAQVISKIMPVYPIEAKQAGIEGAVLLHAIIGTNGTVENLTVLSGPAELQRSALDAVSQWVYKPYLLNGDPVEVETTITVNYSLAK
jgi:TonB family protein